MRFESGKGFSYVRLFADEHGESHFEDVAAPADADGDVTVTAPIPLSAMIIRRVDKTDADAVRHTAPRRQPSA